MTGTTWDTAQLEPSKLSTIVELLQSSGLLQRTRFFSCGHWQGDPSGEYDTRERVIIKFQVYNPQSTNIEFAFWSDGVIDLIAHPTKHGIAWYMEPVLVGTYPAPASDLVVMIEGTLEIMADTLRLYSTSQPMDDYEPLIRAWEPLKPELRDTAERLKELQTKNADVPEASTPWWHFWRQSS
jgi:hypothetical protein